MNSLIDAYGNLEDNISNGLKSIRQKAQDLFKKPTCKSGGCKQEQLDGSIYCKYHKCTRCEHKRERNNIYCFIHKTF